jgi:hypothetical protein
VTEVIDSHLHFETIFCLSSFGDHHYACIVDQEIDFGAVFLNKFGKLNDGLFVTEVKNRVSGFDVRIDLFDFFDDFFEFSLVPGTNDKITVFEGKIQSSFSSDTSVASSNDSKLSSKIFRGSADSACHVILNGSKENDDTARKGKMKASDVFVEEVKDWSVHK